MQPSDTTAPRDSSLHGPGVTGVKAALIEPHLPAGSRAEQRWAAMSWYTHPVAHERCESTASIAMKDNTAEKMLADVASLLNLPDDVIENNLARIPDVADLARLAKLADKALRRVVPVGTPIPEKDLPPIKATPKTVTLVAPPPPIDAVTLNPRKWIDLPLEKRTEINHNTLRLRFKLPTEKLGLPVGMHIFLKAKVDGSSVMRAYTPAGFGPYYVEFVIKVYFPLPPKFPEGGKLTQHLHAMKEGDLLSFKGPLGELNFDENITEAMRAAPKDTALSFLHNNKPGGSFKHLGFIAGGSGITPCLQVATALLELDRTLSISLLYANQTAEDILCQEEIDALCKDNRFKVWYTVDRPTDDWKYSVGFINEEMCREHLPLPSDDTFIFMCGPPPMIKFACRPNLQEKIGHDESHVLAF